MRKEYRARVRWIAAALLVAALIIIVRLYVVQIVQGDDYRARAEAQYERQSTSRLERGSIFFTEKDGNLISGATLSTGYIVALNTRLIEDDEALYALLSSQFPDLSRKEFDALIGDRTDSYVEVKRRVPDEVGRTLLQADIKGVDVLREQWRFYPGVELASHVIGILGYGEDGETIAGRYGLERYYNDELAKSGSGLYANFFAELFKNLRSGFTSETAGGADVVTTIEPTVQQYMEGVLEAYGREWNPRVSGVIVMNPKTGEIISMAARPAFDPNDTKGIDIETLSNPMVESVFEFGSTMKPLTMAAAIDSKAVTRETTYVDRGFAVYDTARISNFDGKARGRVPMQEVLNQSLNTGIGFIVERMGTKTTREYFARFGLTEETGIDLPSEATPLVDNLETSRTIEYVTAGFGQGIAVTPIAMTRALAALANGGVVPGPHVGKELTWGGGITRELGWSPDRQAISPESAEEVTRMLVEVVDTALKGGTVRIPEYSVAAKTGTAQIAKEGSRGYYDDRYLHSFFGYFPAYEPQFLIFFFAAEPKGARYASETWTDPFIETVKFLATYYDVPPDRAEPIQ